MTDKRERQRLASLRYRAAHLDERRRRERETKAAWREAHPENRIIERRRVAAWTAANPDKVRAGQARIRAERRAFVDELKLSSGCVDCGYNAHAEALHFDHREPAGKLFTIGGHLTAARTALLAEIAKCDIRCANCHAVRTKQEGHSKVPNDGPD